MTVILYMNYFGKILFEITRWIYRNYGCAGCSVIFLIFLSLHVLLLILMNRLPKAKTVTIWSICLSCKYKRKESNELVLACRKHESARFFSLKLPPCPCRNQFARERTWVRIPPTPPERGPIKAHRL